MRSSAERQARGGAWLHGASLTRAGCWEPLHPEAEAEGHGAREGVEVHERALCAWHAWRQAAAQAHHLAAGEGLVLRWLARGGLGGAGGRGASSEGRPLLAARANARRWSAVAAFGSCLEALPGSWVPGETTTALRRICSHTCLCGASVSMVMCWSGCCT